MPIPQPHDTEFYKGDLVAWFNRDTAVSFRHHQFGDGPFVVVSIRTVHRPFAEHPQEIELHCSISHRSKWFSGLWFRKLASAKALAQEERADA